MSRYAKGKIVKGIVSGIETYGIFVTFDEGILKYYKKIIELFSSKIHVLNPMNVVWKFNEIIDI